MRVPNSLVSLTDLGIIQEVLRPLMSGKEAEVYLVLSGGEERVAKVYKEAQNRTFRQRSEYTEGRSVRNSRDQRAMSKRTKHGRAQDEAAWRSTEVDMIYRLRNAGVRVPTPHHFIDGVLIMELVADAEGNPAPRLGELALERNEAIAVFDRLIVEVIRMLSAGVVHGDLSDFNVLMGADGPVVIDFPQAVDASSNQNARKLLLRDVDNLNRFMQRCIPDWQPRPYAAEMWELYKRNQLSPDTRLTGRYRPAEQRAKIDAVVSLIADADHDERRRREALGLSMPGSRTPPRRVEVVMTPTAPRGGARPGGRPPAGPDVNRQSGQRSGGGPAPSNGPRNQPNHAAPRAWPADHGARTNAPVGAPSRPSMGNVDMRTNTAAPQGPRRDPAFPVAQTSVPGATPNPGAPGRSRRRRRRRSGSLGSGPPHTNAPGGQTPRATNAAPAERTHVPTGGGAPSDGPRKFRG